MAALDYYGIQESLRTMLRTAIPEATAKHIFIEGMEREVQNLAHMPLLNIRMTESNEELTSLPDGVYERINILVDVIAFDLTQFKEAASLRDSLLRTAKDACRANRKFAAGIETSSVVGQTTFGAASSESGGHVALATFNVLVEAYVEP